MLPFSTACNRNSLFLNDETAPEITRFQITSPLSTTSPDITFIISSSNDDEVSAWLVNESPSVPSSSDPGWTAVKPGGYTLKSGFGKVTVYVWAKDSIGNISLPLSQTVEYINPDIPTIISITSTTTDGTYGGGSVITITVTFSENVTLTGGNLNITLDTGAVVPLAPFGPSATVSGTYTVSAAENSSNLDAVNASLSGGTLLDATGNSANLTLPAATIATGSAIVVDTRAPVIASLTSGTSNGSYAAGSNIDITINFSEPVILSGGTLDITLDTGDVISVTGSWPASTASGTYTVANPDTSLDLTATAVNQAGGTLRDTAGNIADLTLPAGNNIADLKNIAVDSSQPFITSITSTTPDGTYGPGTAINVRINFNEPVRLSNDNLQIDMDTGGFLLITPFGAPSAQINGTYTISGGETSADLNVIGITYVGSALLTDAPGNSALLTLPGGSNLADNKALGVDTTAPVVAITAPADTTIVNGTETISFTDSEPANPRVSVDNINWTNVTGGITAVSAIPQFAGLGEGGFTLYIRDTDPAGNNGSSSISLTKDTVPPNLVISAPSAAGVNSSGSVNYTVTYTGASTVNLTAGDIILNKTGTASCTLGVTNGTTTTPAVTFSACSGEGTVGISIAPGTSQDAIGNIDTGTGPAIAFSVDNTGPTLGINTPSVADVNTSGSSNYTVAYVGASAVNLTAGNITLITTGTATCTVGVTNGTTTTPTVTLSACSGDGTAGISIAGGTSQDTLGNPDSGAVSGTAVTVDNTQPSLSFSLSTTNPTNLGSYTVTFNFSEDVTGFDTTDVIVTNGTKGTFTPVTGSQYTLVVNPSAEGTVTIAVISSAASDTAGNMSNGNTLDVIYDATAPVVAINSPASSAAVDGTSVITFVSSEAGVTEVSVNGGFNWTAAVSGVTAFYDIAGYLGQGDGMITLDLRVTDAAGNTGYDAVSLTKAEDTGGPKIISVEYYDTDSNGRIDHAKLVFQRAVVDSTFDGFIPGPSQDNQLHGITNVWRIAGYSNVRLDTSDAIDTGTDDDTLWLAFDEIGTGGDTGAKPDLTAYNSSLVDIMNGCYLSTSSADCTNINAADISTADVIELDRARPVPIDFRTQVSGTTGNIFFSEPVDSAAGNGCDPADVITTANIIYGNSGGGISAITDFLPDSNGCGDGMVTATFDTAESGDIGFDSIKANQVYDAADNAVDNTIPATLTQFANTQMQILQGSTVISNGSGIFNYGIITGDPYPYKKIVFRIANNAGAFQNLELTGDPMVQSDTGNFIVTQQPKNRVITPGSSQEFTVAYAPTATGLVSGTITVPSNDRNSPYTISLEGDISVPVLQQLVPGAGTTGDIVTGGDKHWYYFDGIKDFSYQVLWEDTGDQSGTACSGSSCSGDIKVSAYGSDFVLRYLNEVNSGFSSPGSITAGTPGRIYVKVEGFDSLSTGTYSLKADEYVRFTPEPGVYSNGLNVVLEHNNPGVTIWYTTDGSDPVVGGNPSTGAYSIPIPLSTSTTVKAVAGDGAGYISVMNSGYYETSPMQLVPGTEYDGSLGAVEGRISNPGDTNWYFFDGTGGSAYMVTWVDSAYQDASVYTADAVVSAYREDMLTAYFENMDNGYRWHTQYITPPASERVYLKIRDHDPSNTGDFYIKVEVVTSVTPMTPDVSYAPGVLGSMQSHWYSFGLLADREYRIYWDDQADGSGLYTGDIIVLPYSDNFQNRIFSQPRGDSGYSTGNYRTIIRPFDERINIRVGSYFKNTALGDYALKVGEVVRLDPKPGFYETPVIVTMSHSQYPAPLGTIKYTTDGSIPAGGSSNYVGAGITVSMTQTVLASVTDGGSYFSIPNGGEYRIGLPLMLFTDGSETMNPINSGIGETWFYFNAVEGQEYDISWADVYNNNVLYKANIAVSAYTDTMFPYFISSYGEFTNREVINAKSTGRIFIRIEEIGGNPSTLDFNIRVYSP